jgi:hypothetical protein
MVSPELESRRQLYLDFMHDTGKLSPAEIAASVRESQAELLEVLRSVPEATAGLKPDGDGEWCLRELTIHAAFSERLIAKLVYLTARGEVPTAVDLEGAGIGMMPSDTGRSYADALGDLEAMNAELIRAVESLPAEPNLELRLPHPIFGVLNCKEWGAFQRVHDTDHIQHARRILAEVSR